MYSEHLRTFYLGIFDVTLRLAEGSLKTNNFCNQARPVLLQEHRFVFKQLHSCSEFDHSLCGCVFFYLNCFLAVFCLCWDTLGLFEGPGGMMQRSSP